MLLSPLLLNNIVCSVMRSDAVLFGINSENVVMVTHLLLVFVRTSNIRSKRTRNSGLVTGKFGGLLVVQTGI